MFLPPIMAALAGKFPDWTAHVCAWGLACVPCMTVEAGKVKINLNQIIQYLFIALGVGLVSGYINITKMEVLFEEFRQETNKEIAEMKQDRKAFEERIQGDFYLPNVPGNGGPK